MDIVKIIKKAALWSFAVFILIIGSLLIINAFDEKIDPAIAEFSAIKSSAIKDGDNAYFAMIMIRAPKDADVHAKGVAWVGAMNKAIDAGAQNEEVRLVEAINSQVLKFAGDRSILAIKTAKAGEEPTETGLDQYLAVKDKLPELLKINSALLDRYMALHKYPAFSSTLKPTLNSPLIFLYDEQRLLHARITLLLSNNRKAEALKLLRDDTALWRRALAGSAEFVERPATITAIKRNMVFLTEILKAYDLSKSELAIIEEIVSPLTEAELDNGPAIRNNFNVGRYVMASFARGESGDLSRWEYYLLRPFFSPNATVNTMYRYSAMLAEFAKFSPGEQVRALRERRIPRMYGPSDTAPTLTMFYNPIGKMILGIGAQDPTYNRHANNLNGLMRLAVLHYLMKRAKVKDRDVEKYIVHSGRSYFDPYGESEMKWDVQTRTIYFYGMDRNGELKERIGVRL